MKPNLLVLTPCIFLLWSCTSTSNKEKMKEVQADSSSVESIEPDELKREPETEVAKQKKIPEGRCDVNIVRRTERKIESLTDGDIYTFLFTFSEDCKNNVEFGEFGNEVLFQVLLKYTEMISNNLKKDSIYQDVILNELANPVTEMQSIDEIIKRINQLEIEDNSKVIVIDSFKATLGYTEN